MTQAIKLGKAKDLSAEMIDVRSQDYSWSKHNPGEEWESYAAVECGECGQIVSTNGYGEEQHKDREGGDCEGYLNDKGPMMNYYYPLPGADIDDPDEEVLKLAHLPLVLVRFNGGEYEDDSWALALSGGGMDLSWEICEAFMRLGYLPPLNFCYLPRMAGMKLTTRTRAILTACQRSATITEQQAQSTRRRVVDTRRWLKEREAAVV